MFAAADDADNSEKYIILKDFSRSLTLFLFFWLQKTVNEPNKQSLTEQN